MACGVPRARCWLGSEGWGWARARSLLKHAFCCPIRHKPLLEFAWAKPTSIEGGGHVHRSEVRPRFEPPSTREFNRKQPREAQTHAVTTACPGSPLQAGLLAAEGAESPRTEEPTMIKSAGRSAVLVGGSAPVGGAAGARSPPPNALIPAHSGERGSVLPPHTPGRCTLIQAQAAVDSHVRLGPDGLRALLLAAQAWKSSHPPGVWRAP